MKFIEFSLEDVIAKSDWCVGSDDPCTEEDSTKVTLNNCFGYVPQDKIQTCAADYSLD